MNKLFLAIVAFTGMSLCSCVVSHTALVTNNPVGDKVGVAKATPFQANQDISFKAAKENGGIDKVGIAETKVTYMVIIPKVTIKVTGE